MKMPFKVRQNANSTMRTHKRQDADSNCDFLAGDSIDSCDELVKTPTKASQVKRDIGSVIQRLKNMHSRKVQNEQSRITRDTQVLSDNELYSRDVSPDGMMEFMMD